MTTWYLEMLAGQPRREVEADSLRQAGGWLIFYRNQPQGGMREYWRVRETQVISMETKL